MYASGYQANTCVTASMLSSTNATTNVRCCVRVNRAIKRTARRTSPRPERRSGEERLEVVRDPAHIAWRGQETGATVDHQLGYPARGRAGDGKPTRHRLDEHVRDAVPVAVGGDDRREGERRGPRQLG